MIPYAEAIERVADAIPRPTPVATPIDASVDCVLSRDVVSQIDVSPFRNSAMDGYAVRTCWFESSTPQHPVGRPIARTIHAGDAPTADASVDAAVKIMTGAPVPDGYDAVVPVEDCAVENETVRFFQSPQLDANIRPPGEDVTKGETIVPSGYRLRALDIGILAGIGMADVEVYAKPRVLIVNTGNEIERVGVPLKTGRIYDSNRHTVFNLIRRFCHSVEVVGPVPDDAESLGHVFNRNEYDVIVSTGGVSAGDRDFVPQVAEAAGWQTVFHKVSIKPGKPVYFAVQDRRLFFGLPGNPLSVAVTCALFVIPALRQMAGEQELELVPVTATLSHAPRRCDRTLIWPGRILDSHTPLTVAMSSKNSSAALTALLGSDGLVIQEIASGNGQEGCRVQFLAWDRILGL